VDGAGLEEAAGELPEDGAEDAGDADADDEDESVAIAAPTRARQKKIDFMIK